MFRTKIFLQSTEKEQCLILNELRKLQNTSLNILTRKPDEMPEPTNLINLQTFKMLLLTNCAIKLKKLKTV